MFKILESLEEFKLRISKMSKEQMLSKEWGKVVSKKGEIYKNLCVKQNKQQCSSGKTFN